MKNAKYAVLCSLVFAAGCSTQRAPDAPLASNEPAVHTSNSSPAHVSETHVRTSSESSTATTRATPHTADGSRSSPELAAQTTDPAANARGPVVVTPLSNTSGASTADNRPVGPAVATGGGPAADNTGVNTRDRNDAHLTPMDQGGSEADRTTTQKIRQAVVGDKALSFNAKNVKIITVNGRVTLRGPVKNDAERASIESKAREVAGATQVDNQLEVKP